jgi:hypothetical protein
MAKDKDKKKGKNGGGKIPKRVAGVKVPKGVRKAGKSALKLAERPVVAEAVAAALLAAAAALRDGGGAKKATKGAGGSAGEAAGAAGKQVSLLGDALRSIAIDVARRTVEAWEESGKKAGKEAGKEPGKGGGGSRQGG